MLISIGDQPTVFQNVKLLYSKYMNRKEIAFFFEEIGMQIFSQVFRDAKGYFRFSSALLFLANVKTFR